MAQREVKVGDVFQENEVRTRGQRVLKVIEVRKTHAVLEAVNPIKGQMRRATIRLKALGSTAQTGFRFLRSEP